MMNLELFEKLLNSDESTVLDFKRESYKLINGNSSDTAKFVKDIISFSNTIRDTSSFIIIGIDEENGTKKMIGINDLIDDNILQAKIKNKVYPRPHFKYLNFEYKGIVYGIIEIPLRRYQEPIMPVEKMKGLEVGKVYCRQGSTNIEANGREIIQINSWITSLPKSIEDSEIFNKISILINKLSSKEISISASLAEGLSIGQDLNNDTIISFCKNEINGYKLSNINDTTFVNHRKIDVLISIYKIEKVHSFMGASVDEVWKDLKSKNDFIEITMLKTDSVHHIEDILEEFKMKGQNSYITEERKWGDISISNDLDDNMPVFIYSNYEAFRRLYSSIRHKYVNILMRILE